MRMGVEVARERSLWRVCLPWVAVVEREPENAFDYVPKSPVIVLLVVDAVGFHKLGPYHAHT